MRGQILSPFAAVARVVFADDLGIEYRVELPREGHSDREVRAVAYRIACQQIAAGKYHPHGELRYVSIGPAD